jgi:hypothetical protein
MFERLTQELNNSLSNHGLIGGKINFSIIFIADAVISTIFSIHFPSPPLVIPVTRSSNFSGKLKFGAALTVTNWMALRARRGCMTESQIPMVTSERKEGDTEGEETLSEVYKKIKEEQLHKQASHPVLEIVIHFSPNGVRFCQVRKRFSILEKRAFKGGLAWRGCGAERTLWS